MREYRGGCVKNGKREPKERGDGGHDELQCLWYRSSLCRFAQVLFGNEWNATICSERQMNNYEKDRQWGNERIKDDAKEDCSCT